MKEPASKRAVAVASKTDWIRVDSATYDVCLDPNDYRKRKKP